MNSVLLVKIGFNMEKFNHAVAELRVEREQLLVGYCNLLSLDMDDFSSLPASLRAFNQLLTDYAALGHFEIFEAIVAEAKKTSAEDTAEVEQLVEQLRSETDKFLVFGEHYQADQLSHEPNLLQVSQDLDELGPVMAERFEIEDRFIAIVTGVTA